MEHVPASYEMVEQPEEPKAEDASGEAKRERPEAAVKGIVPDQPAPIVPEHRPQPAAQAPVRTEAPRPVPASAEAATQSGFMSKILGWFKTDKQEAPAANDALRTTREPRRDPQQQRERRPDQRRDEQRRDHRRDRPRDENRGGEQRRPQQGGERRPDQRHGGQQQRDHRQGGGQGGERRPDQQRQQRPQQQRPPRPEQEPQGEQPQQPQQPQQQAPRGGEGEQPRRGRRNRRDRHRERRPDQTGEQRPPQGLPVAEHDAGAPLPAFLAKAPDASELRAREREMHLAQMREEAAARESARQEPAAQEPVHAQPAPPPQPAPVPIDPREILESAGLQMVETDASKARPPAAGTEPVQLGRPRREKPVIEPASEELVQVETRDK
jgi:ribonuclease E